MLTIRHAWRLRQRGVLLPECAPCETLRLAQIAIRQAELMREMDSLDSELYEMHMSRVDQPVERPVERPVDHFGKNPCGEVLL